MTKYDIHNPTQASRIIWDGIPKNGKDGPQTQYQISPGETRSGVALSEGIAEDLIKRTSTPDTRNSDLRLTPHKTGDAEPAKVAASGRR